MNEIIFRYFNSFAGQTPLIDRAIVFGAETFGIILLLGLVAFLFSHEDKGKGFRDIIVVLGAGVFAWAVSWLMKHAYPYPRPFLALDGVTKLIDHGGMDSFPSGHATFFSAIATALYFYHKKIAAFYALGALLIGVSRVAAGIHWPLDVIAGYLIGGAVAVLAYSGYQALALRRSF